ncbi:phage major capsid protein [Cryobacterium sp. TMB1-7]|uniref:phage major capsid protein n=1 Tax=Cryobacterium sp. TMB1-7 TaxID=2555866 RepID=UPI00106B3C48|nr:phage major capsid protein [Cryobacterium sp. TMB1-7]
MIDLQGSLASPYARSDSAAWLMRNSTLTVIKKLRDSTGRYIFDSSEASSAKEDIGEGFGGLARQ